MKLIYLIKNNKYEAGLIVFAFLVAVLFIFAGLSGQGISFPLDDAWIHQTYARNLASTGQWAYSVGKVSGGSTSPLWTVLVSAGYLISETGGLIWTFILSISSFVLLVLFSCLTIAAGANGKQKKWLLIVAGGIIALEWHLLWSTASGMETIFFSLGIVVIIYLLFKEQPKWWQIGLINGLLVWVRPDGLTLFGPVLLILVWGLISKKYSCRELISFLLPLIICLGVYISFNFLTTGHLFPNTFYAKQTEYRELLRTPVFTRIINELIPLLTGSGILILPGFIYFIWESARTRNIKSIALVLWITGFLLLYALRLPVTYQHGRYIFPLVAPFYILGMRGCVSILKKITSKKWKKLASTAWIGTLLIVSVAFYTIGVTTYHDDVKVINQLLVQPAKWVFVNLVPDDVIATHDIGAMGYFTQNKIVDLAGLINPDIIPIMRDEKALLPYMQNAHAKYFIGFTDWYHTSSSWGDVVMTFSTIYQNKLAEVVVIELK